MSFILPLNTTKDNMRGSFNLEDFNEAFEKDGGNKCANLKKKVNPFIDPDANYTNPEAENYVDPESYSTHRMSIVFLFDKHQKKYLTTLQHNQHYILPTGKTKVIEYYEDAAARILQEKTGLFVEPKNMELILDASGASKRVNVFLAQVYKGKIIQGDDYNVTWVHLKNMNNNKTPQWKNLYNVIYDRILTHMY